MGHVVFHTSVNILIIIITIYNYQSSHIQLILFGSYIGLHDTCIFFNKTYYVIFNSMTHFLTYETPNFLFGWFKSWVITCKLRLKLSLHFKDHWKKGGPTLWILPLAEYGLLPTYKVDILLVLLFKIFINTFSLRRFVMKKYKIILGCLHMEVINVLYDKGINHIKDKTTSSSMSQP